MLAPQFSVIIPLESHRGEAVRCVRGWAEDQTLPRDCFELVVASPPDYPAAELEEIRRVLDPKADRLLELEHDHDMGLCADAAKVARGELLFFTESHCHPEPVTLARADAAARAHPHWAGFSCTSVPITHNLLSAIEAEAYGREIEFGLTEHPWRKVLDQCFVVKRSAYFRAGGFDPAYGHFAEWLLAARLHALGLTIGYAPEARIHHVYLGKFSEWRRFTKDFVVGQMRYLATEGGDPLRSMFDEVPEWSARDSLRRDVARRMCRMLLQDLTRAWPRLWQWEWGVFLRWLVRAAGGASGPVLRARLRYALALTALRAHLLLRRPARAKSSLARCCEAVAAVERTKFAVEHDAAHAPSPLPDVPWRPGHAENRGVGFHLSSGSGANAIRWTEPAAYVELPLAPGRHRVELAWLFRPPVGRSPRLTFFLDESPIPDENVRICAWGVALEVDVPQSPSPPRLGWVCTAHHAQGDDRSLGLPVTRLAWDREISRLVA